MNTEFSQLETEVAAAIAPEIETKKPLLEFLTPNEMKAYRAPEGSELVGDSHIVRGAVFVIGGAPGVGKSRASVALAMAGALREPWFGLSIQKQFRTMIIQNENGRKRLSDEFFTLPCDDLESWIRVSPPPPFGIDLNNPDFQNALKEAIAAFVPDVVLFDPWNALAPDDKARDYMETFKLIRKIVPAGDNSPAIGIVAHTRKPKHDERASGRGLSTLLAGSYILASVPRTVFVLQPASDATEDSRVVFTCCKNNDGDMGAPSAWKRRNGLFEAVSDFDWEEFGKPTGGRSTITEEDMAEIFEGGTLSKGEARKALMERTRCAKSAAYEALELPGRFDRFLKLEGGKYAWRP